MKKMLAVLLIMVSGLFAQEQIINSFDTAEADTNYWLILNNDGADTNNAYIDITFPTTDIVEGSGAMRLDYSVHNTETWGGFTKLEHWNQDSTAYYDWSLYDTIAFHYYIEAKQSLEGRVHLRLNLHDASDSPNGPNTYDVADVEYYYSMIYILDGEPGWNEWRMPLENNLSWDGQGFNLTGWSGAPGNGQLDLDKIKGFSLEFSISGAGEGDFSQGVIIVDKLYLRGAAENPVVLFNGAAVPGDVSLGLGGWSDHAIEITNEQASTPGTNSIKWTLGSDWAMWDGPTWTLNSLKNLGYRWTVDSLKFKIKADAGLGALKAVILDDDSDGDGEDLMFEAGYMIEESMVNYDGTWKQVSIPLRNFSRFDGGWNGSGTTPGEMDSTRVKQVKILMASTAGAKKVVYLDDVWTGNPEFDVVAPLAPELVTVSPGSYVNLITWADVPGESNETYDVYYSFNPITDVTAEGVEVVKMGIVENEQAANHVLKAPINDQTVTYYYAVVCNDAAGNASPIGVPSPESISNTAQGVPTIHPTAPSNFAADGNLGEWSSVPEFSIKLSEGTGFIPANQQIDGDADLSVKAWLAVDDDYLYYAFDITDDVNSVDTTLATYLTDGADIFFGLYDWRGPSHTGYKRGSEPDYHLRFISNGVYSDNPGGKFIKRPGENYVFEEKFPSGYIIEGKLSFAELAAIPDNPDDLFSPLVGMRIPLDYAFNDADGTGQREGILTYSPNNEDQSWNNVSRWTYTWIGDQMVDVDSDEETIVYTFDLGQNYPNPFNPSTVIKYSIPSSNLVELKVFNILGQEVASLVNEVKNAGVHTVSFNASSLASGVYLYRITAGSFVSTKKMLLIK